MRLELKCVYVYTYTHKIWVHIDFKMSQKDATHMTECDIDVTQNRTALPSM